MVVAERVVTSVHAVDYRIERLPILEHPEAHLAELLDRLNEMGKQGWRVVSVDLTHHPSYSAGGAAERPPARAAGEAGRASPRPVEYRIERLPFQEHPERHLSELLDRLTALGKQGWCVACVDLTHHPSYSPAAQPSAPLPVLLERET